MIPLTTPVIEADDLEAVREALVSGHLVQGPRVVAFEEAIARRVGAEYAVAMSSCTAALHASMLSIGVRAGDLVIVPAYSFIATANVVELCGAQPIFVDIRADTFTMDPERLAASLDSHMAVSREHPRVRAVVPVHAFGQLADMDAILSVAGRYEVPVIEDAACALGARFRGRHAGTLGTIGCFSFHPRKAITTGEGGVAVTPDPEIAQRLRALRNHGLDPASQSRDYIMPGLNYRMTEIQAALGLSQLRKLDRLVVARKKLAERYDALCSKTGLRPPVTLDHTEPVYQSYVVLLPGRQPALYSDLPALIQDRGVEVTLAAQHMPMTRYFRERYGYEPGDFPVADSICERSLSLPLYQGLTPSEQEYVVDTTVDCLSQLADAMPKLSGT